MSGPPSRRRDSAHATHAPENPRRGLCGRGRKTRRARLLQHPGQIRGRDVLGVPAEAHLAVTRDPTAPTIRRTRFAVLRQLGHHCRAPTDRRHLLHRQPMWMSTACAPISSQMTAASRISSGPAPKSWMEEGAVPRARLYELERGGLRSISERALTRLGRGPFRGPQLAQVHPHREVECRPASGREEEVRIEPRIVGCACPPRTMRRPDAAATGNGRPAGPASARDKRAGQARVALDDGREVDRAQAVLLDHDRP